MLPIAPRVNFRMGLRGARLVFSLTGPGRNGADVCSGVYAQLLGHV